MRGRIVELAVISLFLGACSATPAARMTEVSPKNTETVAPQTATDIPVATEAATAMPDVATATQIVLPMSTPIPLDAPDATALVATSMVHEQVTCTPYNSDQTVDPLSAMTVVPFATNVMGLFFATMRTGFLNTVDTINTLRIYQKQGTQFDEITHYDFKNGSAVGSVEFLPNPDQNHALLLVNGSGIGGSFTVLSFDGNALTMELETYYDDTGGKMTAIDVNHDGAKDVIIDATDYIFYCMGCGVKQPADTVFTWDGTKFAEQKLTASSDTTIQKAIDYANAQRWNKVRQLLPTITTRTTDSDKWNVALLTHMATVHTPNKDSAFPLLDAIFYGDYDGAVKMLQAVGAKEAAKPKGAWFAGTFKNGQDKPSDDPTYVPTFDNVHATMMDTVVQLSTAALTQDDAVTSARFLRGWAKTMVNPKDPEGLADLDAVASANPFYAAVRDAIVSR